MRMISIERRKTMDMNEFYDKLIHEDKIKDIPLTYVLRIAIVILEIINSGECMHELEDI